jgi:hypothetical protein
LLARERMVEVEVVISFKLMDELMIEFGRAFQITSEGSANLLKLFFQPASW